MNRAERWLPCLLILLAGCMDEPNVDVGMDGDTTFADARVTYAPGDEFATLTENGAVKLGLTSDRIYFTVSDAVRDHVDQEIASGVKDADSRLARSIGGAVRRGVQSALSFDIDFGSMRSATSITATASWSSTSWTETTISITSRSTTSRSRARSRPRTRRRSSPRSAA
jgi:hypothetical protein